METGYTVFVEALESRIAHVLAQVLEGGHTKQLQHPVGQYQPVLELVLVSGQLPVSSLSISCHILFLVTFHAMDLVCL